VLFIVVVVVVFAAAVMATKIKFDTLLKLRV